MMLDKMADEILGSKKYRSMGRETVLRLLGEEAPKYRSPKEAVKAVKSRLHQISQLFMGEAEVSCCKGLLAQKDGTLSREGICEVLGTHLSSRERLGFVEEMLEDIFRQMPGCRSVLDIACGLSPFALLLVEHSLQAVYATDIHSACVGLLGGFYEQSGLGGEARVHDILCGPPPFRADAVFLFKILPLLERQKKGYGRELVEALDARWFVITYPTKSVSNKNVGMYGQYSGYMKEQFPQASYRYLLEREYPNELVYVIERKGGCI